MRILILNWRDIRHPHAGGAEVVTFEHAKAWVKAGHNVTWFSSGFRGGKKEEIVEGIKIVRRGKELLTVHTAAFFWYLKYARGRVDLVVDQFHGIPFFTPLYIRTKKLAFIHEVAKEVWRLNPWPKPFNLIPAIVGRLGEPWVFKIFYKKIPFMAVSESTKKDLVAWGIPSQNITVVHNGVNVPENFRHRTSSTKRDKVAMYLGALSHDKGIGDALKAFSILSKKDKGWHFWVVGKGDEKMTKFLNSKVEKLGIRDKVKFWGYVNEKKKFELLSKARVLVNPSVHEGWGLVNIEANSMGVPVVGYNVAGMRDSVRQNETGILSELGDHRGLAADVLKLASSRKFYARIQKKAVDWSRKFRWKKATRRSLKTIKFLLEKGEI